MIGRLKGTIAEESIDGTLVLDVRGVGYEVRVPLGTAGRLTGDDEEVTLFVHTHVTAESLALYGFASLDDRAAFRALLGVNKVGPKLAIAIMGAVDAHQLADAVAREDRAALSGIPGVGKKTVERIFLDLQGKLLTMPGTLPAKGPKRPSTPAPTGVAGVVVGALMQMGYKRGEAEGALDGLETEGKEAQDLLREALRALG